MGLAPWNSPQTYAREPPHRIGGGPSETLAVPGHGPDRFSKRLHPVAAPGLTQALVMGSV